MRRVVLLSLLLAAVAPAATAQADSTTTRALGPGESMRSSPDAAPSAATPVIATVTVTSIDSMSYPPPATTNVTIAMKDRPDSGPGENPEGPSGYEYMGPNVTIGADEKFTGLSVVFEVDGSSNLPGFLLKKTGGSPNQFSFHQQRPGEPVMTGFNYMALDYGKVEKLSGGDFRFTPEGGNGYIGALGSFDLLQQAFYADPSPTDDSLPDALRKGIGVFLKTNYAATVEWAVKVSTAVAKKLKLKSTTIAAKTFAKPGGEYRHIPFTASARKALKHYKRVAVTLHAEATGPDGQVITKKKALTLRTPESDLG